jgi:hypothetical protein
VTRKEEVVSAIVMGAGMFLLVALVYKATEPRPCKHTYRTYEAAGKVEKSFFVAAHDGLPSHPVVFYVDVPAHWDEVCLER